MIEIRCTETTLVGGALGVVSTPEGPVSAEEDETGDGPDDAAEDDQSVASADAGHQVDEGRQQEEHPAVEVSATHPATLARRS